MKYSDQIKHPKWQKKRLEVLNLKGFKCEVCENEDKTLHVHHRFYLKNRNAWEYDNDVFQVLCEDCHSKIHAKNNKDNIIVNDYCDEFSNLIEEIVGDTFAPFDSFRLFVRRTNYLNAVKCLYEIYKSETDLEQEYLHKIHGGKIIDYRND